MNVELQGSMRWKRAAGRLLWIAIGIVLGMVLLALLERYVPLVPPGGPRTWRITPRR